MFSPGATCSTSPLAVTIVHCLLWNGIAFQLPTLVVTTAPLEPNELSVAVQTRTTLFLWLKLSKKGNTHCYLCSETAAKTTKTTCNMQLLWMVAWLQLASAFVEVNCNRRTLLTAHLTDLHRHKTTNGNRITHTGALALHENLAVHRMAWISCKYLPEHLWYKPARCEIALV